MLSNAYFLAKFRFDTAENEPAKNLQNFANFPNFADPDLLERLDRFGRVGGDEHALPRREAAALHDDGVVEALDEGLGLLEVRERLVSRGRQAVPGEEPGGSVLIIRMIRTVIIISAPNENSQKASNDPDKVSVRGERANFTRLVLGCIEANICK